jgi:hypothetical protein
LKKRRKQYLKESIDAVEEKLKIALREEPPPTLQTLYSRLGMENHGVIQKHFLNLAKAIIDRHKEYRGKWRQNAKLELEAALTEIPPPSINQIARRVRCAPGTLRRNFPDLHHQIAVTHIEYMLRRKLVPKKPRKRSRVS